MPGANGGITNFQAVDDIVCFLQVVNFVVNLFNGFAVPVFGLIEFLHHRPANRFAAHVHGNEARRKKRPVFVPVYFLENQAKHRRVDQRFIFFLNFFGSLAGKIIRIEKSKQVLQRIQFPAPAFPGLVFQHG